MSHLQSFLDFYVQKQFRFFPSRASQNSVKAIVNSITFDPTTLHIKITGTCLESKQSVECTSEGIDGYYCGVSDILSLVKFSVRMDNEKLDESVYFRFLLSQEDQYYEKANSLLSKLAPDSAMDPVDLVRFFRPQTEQLLEFLAKAGVEADEEAVKEFFE